MATSLPTEAVWLPALWRRTVAALIATALALTWLAELLVPILATGMILVDLSEVMAWALAVALILSAIAIARQAEHRVYWCAPAIALSTLFLVENVSVARDLGGSSMWLMVAATAAMPVGLLVALWLVRAPHQDGVRPHTPR